MAGGIVKTSVYNSVKGTENARAEVHRELVEGLEVLIENDIDMIICEVILIQLPL